MDANWIGNLIVITAITSLAAFGVWRGFCIRLKGWGIELRVEREKSYRNRELESNKKSS